MKSLLQLARGACLAGLLTGFLLVGLLLTPWGRTPTPWVFLTVALCGFVFSLIPQGSQMPAILGALGVAAFGVVSGASTGAGALEWSAVVAGALGALWIGIDPGTRVALRPAMSIFAIGFVLVALLPLVLGGETLGHDESAYALKARSWLEGTPQSGWAIHRAPLLSLWGYLALAVGGDEGALRVFGWASVGGLAMATWWLGRRTSGRVVAPVAALVIVASPAILHRGTEFLTDLPSAALLVTVMAIMWRELGERTAGATYRLLWVLPLAWAAFYLRYQSALSLGLIALAAALIWWRRITARPGPIIAVTGIGLAGLTPHFVHATSETGSPLGILLFTGEVAGREFVGEGLVDYAALLRGPLLGLVALPLIAGFIWWLFSRWSDGSERKLALFLAIPTLGQVILLGLVSHGEARFVFFPIALLAIGGVAGIIDMTTRWRPRLESGARLALMSLLIGSVGLSVGAARRSVENRILSNEPVELAAELVRDSALGDECGVLTSYTPQVTFYSGCMTQRFEPSRVPADELGRLRGDTRFMILVEDGKRQPEDEDLRALVALTIGEVSVVTGEREMALVYEFD